MPTVETLVCPICEEPIDVKRDKHTGARVHYCARCQREYKVSELKQKKVNAQALITPRHYERSA